MLADLTLEQFRSIVGSTFECRTAEGEDTIACELREASPLPTQPGHEPARQPFSLLFLAKTPSALGQQLYTFSHPQFPEAFELFLVPVGQIDGELLLEAVFN